MQSTLRSCGTALEKTSLSQPLRGALTVAKSKNLIATIRERRLVKVMQSLESRLPSSVRELADQVHLSPDHLQRLFKQETGINLSEMLSARRLEMAADLLITTDMEVKQVAYFVGYGHHSSFVRAFHRRFGQTPKNYRRTIALKAV